MQVLAIIPARGGSKGIPRKNVVPLCGKPLLGWMIEAAKQSQLINRVAVSTDDAEIARVATLFGAEVIWRPTELSGDLSSSEAALLHGLDRLERDQGYLPELLVFLQCTTPLTTSDDIDGTIRSLLDQHADSALAVTPFHHFLWRNTSDGVNGINHDKSRRLMRQQMEPEYLETGAVYVMRTRQFREHRHRFFGKTTCYVMPTERSWEIDEPLDLDVVEALMRRRLQQRASEQIPANLQAVVFDFDGVFTDNAVYVDQDGRETVRCSRSDGLAFDLLRQTHLRLLVLSSETNPVVRARCAKLNIPVVDSTRNKWPVLREWLQRNGINPAQTAYVGNDVNDLECLVQVGCGVAVADALPEVKQAANLVLGQSGGHGAIREFAELVLQRLGERRYVAAA